MMFGSIKDPRKYSGWQTCPSRGIYHHVLSVFNRITKDIDKECSNYTFLSGYLTKMTLDICVTKEVCRFPSLPITERNNPCVWFSTLSRKHPSDFPHVSIPVNIKLNDRNELIIPSKTRKSSIAIIDMTIDQDTSDYWESDCTNSDFFWKKKLTFQTSMNFNHQLTEVKGINLSHCFIYLVFKEEFKAIYLLKFGSRVDIGHGYKTLCDEFDDKCIEIDSYFSSYSNFRFRKLFIKNQAMNCIQTVYRLFKQHTCSLQMEYMLTTLDRFDWKPSISREQLHARYLSCDNNTLDVCIKSGMSYVFFTYILQLRQQYESGISQRIVEVQDSVPEELQFDLTSENMKFFGKIQTNDFFFKINCTYHVFQYKQQIHVNLGIVLLFKLFSLSLNSDIGSLCTKVSFHLKCNEINDMYNNTYQLQYLWSESNYKNQIHSLKRKYRELNKNRPNDCKEFGYCSFFIDLATRFKWTVTTDEDDQIQRILDSSNMDSKEKLRRILTIGFSFNFFQHLCTLRDTAIY